MKCRRVTSTNVFAVCVLMDSVRPLRIPQTRLTCARPFIVYTCNQFVTQIYLTKNSLRLTL